MPRLDTDRREKRSAIEDSLINFFPDFRNRLEQLMQQKHVDLKRLQKETGLSRPTLKRIASGESNPLLGNIIRIANSLGSPVADLLGRQRGAVTPLPASRESNNPLLGPPPLGDQRALMIYEALCFGTPIEEVRGQVKHLSFPMPGEDVDDAISRAVLDVFYHSHAWIDAMVLPRRNDLEQAIAERYDIAERKELRDGSPVRVIDVSLDLLPLIQIHAIAAVAAEIVKELLGSYRTLGFSDGFTASTVQMFLRRGDVSKTMLIPLVYTPRFAQFELSGAALIGSLARTHHGYRVRSTIALKDLREHLDLVDVAVTSCGSAVRDMNSRIPRIVRECPDADYPTFIKELKRKGVVGDLMYNFLKISGRVVKIPEASGDLDDFKPNERQDPQKASPPIYSASLDCLAGIAGRGVCLLVVHLPERAAVVHAALQRKSRPINFIVTTAGAAEELLRIEEKQRRRH